MFVWSKRLVAALLGLFVLMLGVFLLNADPDSTSGLKIHTTRWMALNYLCLLYTSPSPRDRTRSRMPSSA